MINIYNMDWKLVNIVTADKIQLNGIMCLPEKTRGVAVCVHGYTSSFTSKYVFFEMLAEKLEKSGWGLLAKAVGEKKFQGKIIAGAYHSFESSEEEISRKSCSGY